MAEEERKDLYKTPTELIRLLCDVVSKNGNLFLNIGPRADGTIPEGMQRRLLAMGDWLKLNGEAIYGSKPWITYGEYKGELIEESDVVYTKHSMRIHKEEYRFTSKPGAVYVQVFQKSDQPIQLDAFAKFDKRVRKVSLIGSKKKVSWKATKSGFNIDFPSGTKLNHVAVFKVEHD